MSAVAAPKTKTAKPETGKAAWLGGAKTAYKNFDCDSKETLC
ncbi:hypothetical protein [Neisseria dentiae]|nr:hypothetical protein [Neisseria dentiae]